MHILPQSFYLSRHHLGQDGSSVFALANQPEFRQRRAFELWLIQREGVSLIGRSLDFGVQTELLFVGNGDREKLGGDRNIYQR